MAYTIHEGCTGCTACARQCPTGAIFGHPEARHTVDPARCTDCGVCGVVCPEPGVVADQLGVFGEHVPRGLRPRPAIDFDSCNGCGACEDICPFGSLAIRGPRYAGTAWLAHPQSCVSCGYCEERCIKGALRLMPPESITR